MQTNQNKKTKTVSREIEEVAWEEDVKIGTEDMGSFGWEGAD